MLWPFMLLKPNAKDTVSIRLHFVDDDSATLCFRIRAAQDRFAVELLLMLLLFSDSS